MNRYWRIVAAGMTLAAATSASQCTAQSAPTPLTGEQALAHAAADNKHAFIVFHKDNGPPTQAMVQVVRRSVETRTDRAAVVFVNVTNPAEAALVTRLGVDRAPMPLTLVLAPNGAVTGAHPQRISDELIAGSFATPALATCLKSLQNGMLVFVCFHHAMAADIPAGVQNLRADPQFTERINVVTVQMNDPAEREFLRQMKINSAVTQGTTTAFFAPPGMLVGKFDSSATASELAAALHKAGKCCDDPNCKHNREAQPKPPATGNQHQATQPGSTTRN